MRRVVIATLTIFIFLAALVGGQLALTKPAKAQTSPPPPGSYNVKDYGARGDGVTNDTSAIRAAINAMEDGDTLYFPAGCYIVKAPDPETLSILPLANRNITVCGDGIGFSKIKVANSCPTYHWLLGPDPWDSYLSGLEICDLTFDHNIANNAITNQAEIMAWPEYTCGAYSGTGINIHDIEIINASSVNNIVLNCGGSGHQIKNVTAYNLGDDPNHVAHDTSFIYEVTQGCTVDNCYISAVTNGPAVVCAIEMHGQGYTVQNCTITDFEIGMNLAGISPWDSGGLVTENTITGCSTGLYLWSLAYTGHESGYGIDGLTISYNNITLTDAYFTYDTPIGIAFYEQWAHDTWNPLDVTELHITNNTITAPLETSPSSYTVFSGTGIGWVYLNEDKPMVTLSNSSITDNIIINFPLSGIKFKCNLDNVSITGNTLTNCGTTLRPEVYQPYKTPLSITAGTVSTLDISRNKFIDDLPVTRNKFFIYAHATSSSGFKIIDNTFQVTGSNRTAFERQIQLDSDTPCPLISGQITGFVPPTHKVQTTSRVTDGPYIWTVGSDGLTWKRTMTSVSPKRGPRKTTVTIKGSNFGKSRRGNSGDGSDDSYYVTFNGTQASDYPEWSDTEIQAVVPEATALGPAPVVVVVGGASLNTDNTFTVTPTASSFYFAEGYTGDNFIEYLCIGNPNKVAATANVTYMFSDGATKDVSYNVSANSRYTVKVNDEVGAGKEVSIRVLSETPNLVAERPMYFNYNGVWTDGSEAAGASSPAKNWYFAEGNTLEGFDQYVTVLNPGGTVANLTFHYMVEGQGEIPVSAQVNPSTRATFKTRDQIGSGKNASLYLESDQNVVAERPMYFNYQGLASNNWTGGHDVVGANSPAKDWYFAEGTTRSGFEQWLTLQNPGSSEITVNATYQLGPNQGNPVQKSYVVPARQRLTVPVNVELGAEKDNSVYLSSTSDFIAERPMYFDYHGAWDGGHVVLGTNDSANTWFFADGYTGDNFHEWLCLQNPGTDTVNVDITYYPTSGTPLTKPWTVPPNSRITVNVNDDAGSDREISTKVSSDNPIIAERPMYFAYQGAWTGGHDVVGFVPSP